MYGAIHIRRGLKSVARDFPKKCFFSFWLESFVCLTDLHPKPMNNNKNRSCVNFELYIYFLDFINITVLLHTCFKVTLRQNK